MINQAFNILASIVALAMLAVALSRKSQTGSVIKDFFGGFTASIKAAGNAGR